MFSSRRYLRWRRSFHNDGSDARLTAKSQLTGLPEKSATGSPRPRARIGHAVSAGLHSGGAVPGLFSLSTFSLSTVPRGAAIVIVKGNSLDTSPAGAHRHGNRSP